jgi:C-terminal processing protease CtpA/Prc
MQRLIAFAVIAFAVVLGAATLASADIPPPYDPYGIGARLAEATPFPKLADVKAGSPAAKAGLKNGDGVIAIDGDYSAAGRVPFYFFARGMQGRQNSAVVLVILRDEQRVFTVKVARTVPLRSNW